jgi:hypothetical protein
MEKKLLFSICLFAAMLSIISCKKTPAEEFIQTMTEAKESLSKVKSTKELQTIEEKVSEVLKKETNNVANYTKEVQNEMMKAFRDFYLEKECLFGYEDPYFHFTIQFGDINDRMSKAKTQDEYYMIKNKFEQISNEFDMLHNSNPELYSEERWNEIIMMQFQFLKVASDSPFSDYRFHIGDVDNLDSINVEFEK